MQQGELSPRAQILAMLLHTVLNVAIPVGLMTAISYTTDRPELLNFALFGVAPWTAAASIVIIWRWHQPGRGGRSRLPRAIISDVLPAAIGWAIIFGAVSLAVGSFFAGELQTYAALDGGISAFMATLMSGIAITKQARAKPKSGDL